MTPGLGVFVFFADFFLGAAFLAAFFGAFFFVAMLSVSNTVILQLAGVHQFIPNRSKYQSSFRTRREIISRRRVVMSPSTSRVIA